MEQNLSSFLSVGFPTSSQEDLRKVPDIDKAVVQGCGGDPNDVWLALINDHAICFKLFQDQIQQSRFQLQAQLCPSLGWILGGKDHERLISRRSIDWES